MPFVFAYRDYLTLLLRLRESIRRRVTEDPAEFEEMLEFESLSDVQESKMYGDFHMIIDELTHDQIQETSDIVVKILNELTIAARALFFVRADLGDALTQEKVADTLCMTIGRGLNRCIYPFIRVEGHAPMAENWNTRSGGTQRQAIMGNALYVENKEGQVEIVDKKGDIRLGSEQINKDQAFQLYTLVTKDIHRSLTADGYVRMRPIHNKKQQQYKVQDKEFKVDFSRLYLV